MAIRYAANCPISRPSYNGEVHVEMGGFAFNVEEGLFIPHDGDDSMVAFQEPVTPEEVDFR